ncbi:hypothetical protein BGZ76_000519 [Entomortierella beljakovae]|nr:hypothetical protein BGZ76_000519 [Entomortierella beljakovae]
MAKGNTRETSHSHLQEAAVAAAPTQTAKTTANPKPKPKPTVTTVKPVVPTTTPIHNATTIIPLIPSATSEQTISSTLLRPSEGAQSGNGAITQSPSSSNTNIGIIAGVSAGILVILALMLGFFVKSKRRRNREAREAELYQQRKIMNKFSDGSSSFGYDDGSDLPLKAEGQYYSRQQSILNKQPEWFAKKSPLEYYKQVPSLQELKQQKEQQQQQQQQRTEEQKRQDSQSNLRPYPLKYGLSDMSDSSYNSGSFSTSSSTTFAQSEASYAAKSLSLSKETYNDNDLVTIALNPTNTGNGLPQPSPAQPKQQYQNSQYQQPRINTQGLHRPSYNAHPSFSGPGARSGTPTQLYQSPSPVTPYSMSSTIASPTPTYQGILSPSHQLTSSELHGYTPPPPSAGPFSPVSPSVGFYDLLDDDAQGDSGRTSSPFDSPRDPKVSRSGTPVSPPPVPKSTRPMSVASTSSLRLYPADSDSEDSIPAVPALPPVSYLSKSP